MILLPSRVVQRFNLVNTRSVLKEIQYTETDMQMMHSFHQVNFFNSPMYYVLKDD